MSNHVFFQQLKIADATNRNEMTFAATRRVFGALNYASKMHFLVLAPPQTSPGELTALPRLVDRGLPLPENPLIPLSAFGLEFGFSGFKTAPQDKFVAIYAIVTRRTVAYEIRPTLSKLAIAAA